MLNIKNDTNIYVYCPAGAVTGGVELLHQIVSILNNHGKDAYIVYYGKEEHAVPKAYIKYNIKICEEPVDYENNILILYEGYFAKAFEFKKIQICFWWLSVDNYYLAQTYSLSFKDLSNYNLPWALKIAFIRCLKRMLKRVLKIYNVKIFSLDDIKKIRLNTIHAYQSEYAKDFLIKNNIIDIFPLKDYINEDNFIEDNCDKVRENIILYNPKKGFKFTKMIMDAGKNFNWVPIQNMSREQIINLMRKSKLYIDFGYHPGKDRLPREAATNGCCVITGKEGSAAFYGDIAIDDEYKFSQREGDIELILHKIKDILCDYKVNFEKQSVYRERIRQEKDEFVNDTMKLFTKN